jgi:hypothetical protein
MFVARKRCWFAAKYPVIIASEVNTHNSGILRQIVEKRHQNGLFAVNPNLNVLLPF